MCIPRLSLHRVSAQPSHIGSSFTRCCLSVAVWGGLRCAGIAKCPKISGLHICGALALITPTCSVLIAFRGLPQLAVTWWMPVNTIIRVVTCFDVFYCVIPCVNPWSSSNWLVDSTANSGDSHFLLRVPLPYCAGFILGGPSADLRRRRRGLTVQTTACCTCCGSQTSKLHTGYLSFYRILVATLSNGKYAFIALPTVTLRRMLAQVDYIRTV